MSLNMVVFGFMRYYLKSGDEVLLNKAEHASNVLPWIELSKEIGFKIKYIPLNEDYSLTLDSIKRSVTPNTKVISLASISNVIGDLRDIKSIGKYCREKGIIFNVDGAQGIPHMKFDFKDSNVDFLSFSGHKMCGPTGVGILVGRYELLEKMKPLMYGGGMNNFFEEDNSYELKSIPTRFEAGTPAIAEVIGLGEAIKYLMNIGMEKIHQQEIDLKTYFLEKVKDIDNIIVYNKSIDSGIVAFNISGVFSQDASIYLNHYNIAVRAGNHCAKMLKDEMDIKNTVRISMYFYNNYEDIDKLIEVLKNSENIFKIVL
jgi:cysteine desulfurase/selenocysteine lyase